MLYVKLNWGSKDKNCQSRLKAKEKILFGPYFNVITDLQNSVIKMSRLNTFDILKIDENAVYYDGIYYIEYNVIDPKEYGKIKFSPAEFDPVKTSTPEHPDENQCPKCLSYGMNVKKYNDGRCDRTEVYCEMCGYEDEY